ncbi:protein transport protein sft2 [Orbilia brochopaga]|uniref:Protein transport protein SFT2 n=1 Tax=Orbilia brochopaga TaxID=3140254 RepID=A0AAV9U633_9PEZI
MAAESQFRSQWTSWSRRDEPVRTSRNTGFLSTISSYNPFGGDGYVRLPTSNVDAQLPARTREEEEAGWFAMSRWDRLLGFGICNLGAAVCFLICFILLPSILVTFRKFAILWTVGSLLFLSSWALLYGPVTYARHLLSAERLPFTGIYFGSITLTLYFGVGLQSYLLTIPAAAVQMCALLWYLVSYFPMGTTGLRFASQFGAQQAVSWLNG